jgi:aminomethyltransferase
MASKRAVSVLRPAVNGFGTRALKAEWAHTFQNSTRTIASQASRPHGLLQRSQTAQSVRFASSATTGEELGKTDLYELHSKYGAKFVPFGGYLMPVQYTDLSIIESHKWTREKASLFDVGHM